MPDEAPKIQRRGSTAEEIRQLAEVLDGPAKGSVPEAARLLCWDLARTWNMFHKTKGMKERFGARTDPEDLVLQPNDEVAREPLLTPSEREMTVRLAQEEKLLTKGDFSKLGLEPEQVQQLATLEKFAGITLSQSIGTAHGGQNKVMPGLLDMFDRFKKKLDDGAWPYAVTPTGDQVLDEAKGIQVLVGISAEVRALYGQLQKNQVLMLRAEELKGDKKNGPGRGKPGFSPGAPPHQTNIQINGVKEVKVSQPDAKS